MTVWVVVYLERGELDADLFRDQADAEHWAKATNGAVLARSISRGVQV